MIGSINLDSIAGVDLGECAEHLHLVLVLDHLGDEGLGLRSPALSTGLAGGGSVS